MRILVPLKRERLCVHGSVHLTCSLSAFYACSLSLSLPFTPRARSIALNKLSVRGSFNATGSHSLNSLSSAHSDGWIEYVHVIAHTICLTIRISAFLYVCINKVCITLLHTESFAYRLSHSRYMCVLCLCVCILFYHYFIFLFGSIRLLVIRLL